MEYIKNLFVKTFTSPPDVAKMSLRVLQNILKINTDEFK